MDALFFSQKLKLTEIPLVGAITLLLAKEIKD